MKYAVKVAPNSKTEKRLISLLVDAHNSTSERYSVQLGKIFGRPYNRYIFGDGIYSEIKEKLS